MSELAKIRRSKGFSQRSLAEAANVSPSSIYEIENSRRKANPSTLRKLADALGVEIADLLEEDERPKFTAPPDVEGYLRSIGAELSALSSEDFSQELVNRALEEGGLTRLVDELREEVEVVSAQAEADPDNQLKRAALRRARNGRYATALAFRTARKYAFGAFLEEEEKIKEREELAKLARDLEREMAGAA